MRRLTQTEFVTQARRVHGDRYSYAFAAYTTAQAKVFIICMEHGLFEQKANHHLQNHGCVKCGIEKSDEAKWSNTNAFIARAREVHKERYDYSSVVYVDHLTKLTVICRKHGPFRQTPSNHLAGNDCPKCTKHISRPCNAWLDSLAIDGLIHEWRIPGTRYHADGYDPATNTIYEFHGTHWHGWRAQGKPDHIKARTGRFASDLYAQTLTKEARIRSLGYNLVVMWEHEWRMRLWLVDKGWMSYPTEAMLHASLVSQQATSA